MTVATSSWLSDEEIERLASAGAIARRIVCTLKPGDEVTRGQRFGVAAGMAGQLGLRRQQEVEDRTAQT